ncbi:hypothetical protein Paes_2405 (plasmid) [Prosthecochloris aestuarii DSM 271]|uniref:Uncharacterized protein n=1 Tax=Prosthecochloris aestuarii (strain DSM 271 / SK 413) TaxID=290512 RepID=B4S9R6_PROA2|nr:hypothetical protein Paes_2405 [Prosthecochloris aestuarii DSM 271]
MRENPVFRYHLCVTRGTVYAWTTEVIHGVINMLPVPFMRIRAFVIIQNTAGSIFHVPQGG